MKKRTLCILTVALTVWSSMCSYAYADNVFSEEVESVTGSNNSTGSAISIDYADSAPSDRYRVEIDWGEMEFCYHPADKIWDTKELVWKESKSREKGSWTTKSGTNFKNGTPEINVNIKNYSSNAVKAHFYTDEKEFTYNPVTVDCGITLELSKGNPIIKKAAANPEPGQKGTPTEEDFVITLGGNPAVPINDSEFVTIIPVTCSIEPANDESNP